MRFLHTADVHLAAPLTGAPYRGRVRRGALDALRGLIAYARMQGVETVLIAGDLFDSPHPDRAAAGAALELIRQAENIKFILAAGNHDPLTSAGYCGLRLPDNIHLLGSEPEIVPVAGGAVVGVSFTGSEIPPELPDCPGERVGLIHGDLAPTDAFVLSEDWVRRTGVSYLAMGHIHKKYQKQIGRTLCAMPGSLTAHGFDECGGRSFYDVRIEDGQVRCDGVPAEGCFFYEEIVSAEDADAAELAGRLTLAANSHREQDIVRLRVTGQTALALPTFLDDAPQVTEIIDETELPLDLEALRAQPTLKGRFTAYMLARAAAEPEKRALYEAALRRGLEAFDK